MINLRRCLFSDKRVAVGIFRCLHKLTEGDDGRAPKHERGHFDEKFVVQLCVGISECPIGVEEVLLRELVFVAQS